MRGPPVGRERFRSPELFLADVLRGSATGREGGGGRVLYRASVAAVDVNGGRLENESGSGSVTHLIGGRSVTVPATVGPPNPRNSVKARILTEGRDQFVSDDRLRIFWPFFPEHMSVPVSPGEHVYVMFEDDGSQHGLWLARVAGHEGANFFRGQDSYSVGSQSGLPGLFPESRVSSDPDDSCDDRANGEVLQPDGRLTSLFGG